MRDVSRYFSGLRRTAVTEWFPEGMEQCLEYWCAEQIDDWLSARDLKKHLKKVMCITLRTVRGCLPTNFAQLPQLLLS